ncbi:FAD-linked oxidase C-terminal domain-containing protein [Lentzea sp. JNUCC 0626]|uniref:FAD-binding oxidoreductase n=1 Tax=Lentzea sp. JNUCC 0626 TaxID=3367513 RepID=UPI00374A4BC7
MSDADRLAELRSRAERIVGGQRVKADPDTLRLHSYDASMEHGLPDLVAAPRDRDQFRALVAAAHACGVPYVVRGAGTGYSGGAVPARGGMIVLTAGLDRVLATDFDAGWVRCEPGVLLATVHRLAADAGWKYPPDPSSHQVCTIGGNIAENAGGPHALGGGQTAHHVRSLELVRPNGSVVELGDQRVWAGGLDLAALPVGAEGTLGAVSAATLRLVRAPEIERVVLATFADQDAAVAAVTDVFASGMLPSAMDMLTSAHVPGLPGHTDSSLLFVGLQGHREEVADQADRLRACVHAHGGHYEVLPVTEFLPRRAELVREKVRRMVAVSGHPRYYLFDATAPRGRLAELMAVIRAAADEYGLPVLNTFHAGDGNVHPTPFYDPDDSGHQQRLRAFSDRILRECAAMGGALTGEHGVGLEKRELMPEFFPPRVLDVMRGVKHVFDPDGLANPGKLLPAEARATPPPFHAAHPRVDVLDAYLEADESTTFAEAAAMLADTPYELCYEPLGTTPDHGIVAAVDAGLPGLREPHPIRPRDLLLGATVGDLDLGGTVTKDVAGYDLRKLVHGGRGRLGTPRRVRLRLLPRPSDTRRMSVAGLAVPDALDLVLRLHRARLPFAHLGVLVEAGTATVTGRLELRGGTLRRHLDRLTELVPSATAKEGPLWTDPPMRMPCGAGVSGAPWDHPDLLGRPGTTAYASVGHHRIWWDGTPEPDDEPLAHAVVAAFGGGR